MFIVNKRNSSIIQNFKNRRKKSKPIALFSTILRSPEVFLSLSLFLVARAVLRRSE